MDVLSYVWLAGPGLVLGVMWWLVLRGLRD